MFARVHPGDVLLDPSLPDMLPFSSFTFHNTIRSPERDRMRTTVRDARSTACVLTTDRRHFGFPNKAAGRMQRLSLRAMMALQLHGQYANKTRCRHVMAGYSK
jgi:hypothetical protein